MSQATVQPSTALKSLGADRVGGYLLVFTDSDRALTERDLHGEYFTKSTDLGLGLYSRVPILYHHAQDQTIGSDVIGLIDTLTPDEVGLWAEGQLEKAHQYRSAVDALIARGVLCWSSGALPQTAAKSNDGAITRWWIVEASLTPQPAMPYRTQAAHIVHTAVQPDAKNGVPTNTDPVLSSISTPIYTEKGLPTMTEMITPTTPVKRLPFDPTEAITVTRATKYSDLSAADMSFMADMLASGARNWTPSEAFYRELAEKSARAVQRGELNADAIRALPEQYGGRAVKANELSTTTQTGYGAEWAADSWRSDLWQKTRHDNPVASLLPQIEMPTNPYELPYESTDPTVSFVAESADLSQMNPSASPITTSKIGSGKQQLSAKKLALRVVWSSELNEDSLIPVVGLYRAQAVRAMQNAIDNVILNGDTVTTANTNINLIDGTPAAGSKYLAFNGLRKGALSATGMTIDAGGSPSLALLRQLRYKLNTAYASRPRDLALICDDQTYQGLLNIPEFLTMDMAGIHATNISGQIGTIDGMAVFASAEIPLTNAAGKVSATAANNTRGTALIVCRPNWVIGFRRQIAASVDYFPWSDAYQLVITARLCLAGYDNQSVAMLYNISV